MYQLVIGMDLLVSGGFLVVYNTLLSLTVGLVQALLIWLLCSSDLPWSIFVTFFHFGTIWYFRCIFYLPHIHLVINHFSKEPWFPLVGNGQDLGIRCGPCYWGDFVDKARDYIHA